MFILNFSFIAISLLALSLGLSVPAEAGGRFSCHKDKVKPQVAVAPVVFQPKISLSQLSLPKEVENRISVLPDPNPATIESELKLSPPIGVNPTDRAISVPQESKKLLEKKHSFSKSSSPFDSELKKAGTFSDSLTYSQLVRRHEGDVLRNLNASVQPYKSGGLNRKLGGLLSSAAFGNINQSNLSEAITPRASNRSIPSGCISDSPNLNTNSLPMSERRLTPLQIAAEMTKLKFLNPSPKSAQSQNYRLNKNSTPSNYTPSRRAKLQQATGADLNARDGVEDPSQLPHVPQS